MDSLNASGNNEPSNIYPPVRLSGNRNIRLLKLLPGRWDEQIEASLQAASLEDAPRYTALSYVWGPCTEDKKVRINGTYDIPITDNLFRALRRTRRRRRILRLWIDAICINQSDHDEKSRQVAMMGEVYKGAANTIVWLGELEGVSSVHLRPAFAHLLSLEYFVHLWISDICWAVQRMLGIRPCKEESASCDGNVASIPSWETRAWTVQEFILSRKVHLRWGKAHVRFRRTSLPPDLITMADPRTLNKVRSRCGLDVSNVKHHINILEAFRGSAFEHQRLIEAYDQLFTYSGLPQATDPRDRVYSVLGLIDQEEARLMGVDYGLNHEHVSAKATFASIQRWHDLRIFFYVKLDRPDTSAVPSWAVDFISSSIPHWQWRSDASFNIRAEADYFTLDSSCQILTIRATALDIITTAVSIPVCATSCKSKIAHSIRDRGIESSRTLLPAADVPQQDANFSSVPSSYDHSAMRQALDRNWNVLTTCGLTMVSALEDPASCSKRVAFVLNAIATSGASEGKAFVTAGGLLGWAPTTALPSDVLVYIRGSEYLFTLRRHGGMFKFKGMAYIPGVGAQINKEGELEDEIFPCY